MTTPNTDAPDTKAPDSAPPPPPHVVALLAAVEVARAQIRVMAAQLETMGSALDAVLAAAQAGHYSLVASNAGRERFAREQPAGGMPPVFGAQPGDTHGIKQNGDPAERLELR